MEAWESAVNEFVKSLSQIDDIQAAVLTGSYATGLQNEKSDIDIFLISKDSINWRERGNVFVQGFLIEYFLNPPKQIYKYMDDGIAIGRRTDALIFKNAKVIFDKTGIVDKIKDRAKKDLKILLADLGEVPLELIKYHLWDTFEEVERAYKEGTKDYFYLYHRYLESLLNSFCQFSKIVLPAPHKIHAFLSNPEYHKKYGLNKFPDSEFASQFVACMEEECFDRSFKNLCKLKDYVFNALGGFKIDGWKLRTPTEV